MATITFVNTNPGVVPGFNPGLEDVLDPTGQVTQNNGSLYEITNKSGGPFDGFKVQLTSSANDFSYLIILNPPVVTTSPTAGKIDGVTVRAPDGTVLLQVTAGTNGFGDRDLVDFTSRLFNPASEPTDAIFNALDQLLNKSNLVQGSDLADHMTAFGFQGSQMLGAGGDDVLSSGTNAGREFVGGPGTDIIRIAGGGYHDVHGGNADGSGGEGTDTLEVVGFVNYPASASFAKITNIDVLRLVAGDEPVAPSQDGARIRVYLDATDIGAGGVSTALAVEGATTDSPFSTNRIEISATYDPAATAGVSLDLSGWTFTDWNESRSYVGIQTNYASAPLADTIVGTSVADEISTYFGDDSLRGGGGADRLWGGPGSDTFVYGFNEAASGEVIAADGEEGPDSGIDRLLLLGDNDFTGVSLYGIEQLAFGTGAIATFAQTFLNSGGDGGLTAPAVTVVGDGNANTLAFQLQKLGGVPQIDLGDVVFQSWTAGSDLVVIRGTDTRDAIAGSSQNDVIAGGDGKDDLQGNAGADAFLFDTAFGKGVDHIVDFNRKEGDMIELDDAIFGMLKVGELKKKAFAFGTKAEDKKDRLIYDKEDGVLRYDDDGSGKHKAHIVAILDDAASLKFGDILVI